MKNNFQIPIINNLRGIAALLVCLFHFVFSTKNYITNQQILDVFYFGQYGVQLFFIISGIVIPLSLLKSNYTLLKFPSFFLKRIIRIEPPYLVALSIAILIIIIRGNVSKLNYTQIALHIGYLIPFFLDEYAWLNEVFWTLAIEFQYYLIISVLIVLLTNNTFIGRLTFYLIFLLMPFLYSNSNFFPFYAPMFLIGILWCLFFLTKINSLEFICLLVASVSVTFFKIGHIDAFIGLFTIIFIHFLKNYSNKLLLFFGNISYTMYLIHPLIGASCINILSHKFALSWQKPIVIIVGFVVTTVSSYILYLIIEKPTQSLSKKIKY